MHGFKLCCVSAAVLLAAACSKDSDKTAGPEPSEATGPSGGATADKAADVDAVLSEYESIRALLAKDTGEGVADHATRLRDLATAQAASASEPHKTHLTAIATQAGTLVTTDASNMAALRLAFGQVSQPLVTLVQADPALSARLHVFECPMAEGYKLWIQPNATLENPYMGQRMLACGSEIKQPAPAP